MFGLSALGLAELRTPMHGIIGRSCTLPRFLELLRVERAQGLIRERLPLKNNTAMAKDLMEMPLSEGACESARIISDCADHLLGLVNDILDFARIESKYVVDCECQHAAPLPPADRVLFHVGGGLG